MTRTRTWQSRFLRLHEEVSHPYKEELKYSVPGAVGMGQCLEEPRMPAPKLVNYSQDFYQMAEKPCKASDCWQRLYYFKWSYSSISDSSYNQQCIYSMIKMVQVWTVYQTKHSGAPEFGSHRAFIFQCSVYGLPEYYVLNTGGIKAWILAVAGCWCTHALPFSMTL